MRVIGFGVSSRQVFCKGVGMEHDDRPLVLHVVFKFATGGLENGVVNLINHMPVHAYRHAVLALTEVTSLRERIVRRDVEFVALNKPAGHGFWQYPQLFQIIRKLKPQIVHSRNLAALEVQVPAWAAGVPVRLHGEHGRELSDMDGSSMRYQRIRRLYRPFVHHYTALSRDLAAYLVDQVHAPIDAVTQVYNGVDVERFKPALAGPQPIAACPFDPAQHWLVGTVGRMEVVKDQVMLAHAFAQALALAPDLRRRMRLVLVGDGPMRDQARAVLAAAGLDHLAWLPGEREDVPDIMRGLHAFALSSLSEGISNAILEAMASGLPVVATAVGGNGDLVLAGKTGYLVPAADPQAMALRLMQLAVNPQRATAMGHAGRQRVQTAFSLQSMVSAYQGVYDRQMRRAGTHQLRPLHP
jgi:sugar transferase (PEP-CTERM/EpsH1 system associated)